MKAHPHSVSVVIPTYNRRSLLPRAIESCQRQSYPADEIIVVDDGSTDDTAQWMERLSRQDPKVRYIRFAENRGAQFARIEGIKAARSEWVAFLDSDDELLPDSLEVRLSALRDCPFAPALIYGDARGMRRPGDANPLFEVKSEQLSGDVYPKLLRKRVLFACDSIMVRKELFQVSGYPDPSFPAWQDKDMIFTIAKHFPILHCGAFVVKVYVLDDRLTADNRRIVAGLRRLIRKYRGDILKYHGWRGIFFWNLRLVYRRLVVFKENRTERYQRLPEASRVGRFFARIAYSSFCRAVNPLQARLSSLCRLYFR